MAGTAAVRFYIGVRFICVLALLGALLPASAAAAPGSRLRLPVSGSAVVSSVSPDASEAGLDVLRNGGNAMDAAIATTFAVGVTRPDMCGIGGGGFMTYRGADGTTDSLDFREQAPAEYDFAVGLSDPAYAHAPGPAERFGVGHQVVGVPGTVAGLAAARARYGTKPLAELIAPAIDLAKNGFEVSAELAKFMEVTWYDLGVYFPESRKTYLKLGLVPYAAGDTMILSDYATSLQLIAANGPDEFYKGSIAEKIVAEMEHSRRATNPYSNDAGTITMEDMDSYTAIWRKPLTTSYRGHQVISAPAPTSGGIAVLEMLNMLEAFDLGPSTPQADRLHILAEVQKLAWADRNAYVADPRFEPVPERTLTNKGYGRERARLVNMAHASSPEPGLGTPSQAGVSGGGKHTTHVSVIDAAGNAVAITCSIEHAFGSRVVAPGTGFILNSQLTDFTDPAVAPGAANEPAPGKRPRSSMAPTIVVRRDRPVLVVGAAGGPGIPMAVLLAITNMIDLDMDIAHAIDAERIDACVAGPLCDIVEIEDARIPESVLADLRSRGHELQEWGEYTPWPWYASAQAASVDPATGTRFGYSDPRDGWGADAE